MKLMGFLALLLAARRAPRPHDDLLRAGQYSQTRFAPWLHGGIF